LGDPLIFRSAISQARFFNIRLAVLGFMTPSFFVLVDTRRTSQPGRAFRPSFQPHIEACRIFGSSSIFQS
jgi:hypothetical protein